MSLTRDHLRAFHCHLRRIFLLSPCTASSGQSLEYPKQPLSDILRRHGSQTHRVPIAWPVSIPQVPAYLSTQTPNHVDHSPRNTRSKLGLPWPSGLVLHCSPGSTQVSICLGFHRTKTVARCGRLVWELTTIDRVYSSLATREQWSIFACVERSKSLSSR